jgi:hypothetical protein
MTDKPDTVADLPLAERQRRAREEQKEIREGIANRHMHLRKDLCALDRPV